MPPNKKKPPSPDLPLRQRRFVAAFVETGNATEAYRRAGFAEKGADANAARLLRTPAVRAAVDQALNEAEVRPEAVARRLAETASFDVADLLDANGRMRPLAELPQRVRTVVEVQLGEDADGPTLTVRTPNRLKALELLAKVLGMLKEKVEHSADDDLSTLIAEAMAKGPKPLPCPPSSTLPPPDQVAPEDEDDYSGPAPARPAPASSSAPAPRPAKRAPPPMTVADKQGLEAYEAAVLAVARGGSSHAAGADFDPRRR